MTGLGLDLGSRWAKLATASAAVEPAGRAEPLALTRVDGRPFAGKAAYSTLPTPGARLVERFTAALAGSDAEAAQATDDVRDFLAALYGATLPPDVAAVVPEHWLRRPASTTGPGDRLLATLRNLGVARPRLVSHPRAVLAYLMGGAGQFADGDRVLLVDVGASSVAVTLGAVRDGRPSILDATWSGFPDVDQLIADAVLGPDPSRPRAIVGLRRAIAAQRQEQAGLVDMLLTEFARGAPAAVAFEVAGHSVTSTAIHEALAPVRQSVEATVVRLRAAHAADLEPGRRWRLVLTGGTALTTQVAMVVHRAVGNDLDATWNHLVPLDPSQTLHAAAFGAALVAAGAIEPGDRFPSAVTLRAHRVAGGRLTAADLHLCAADELAAGQPEPTYAAAGGTPVSVDVSEGAATSFELLIDGQAVLVGDQAPSPGTYHIGLQLDPAGRLDLICREIGSGRQWRRRVPVPPVNSGRGDTR
ncbi:hypothetical protein AB0B31_35430 [Catellatospora citrea]|uniref:hypothetical protein n=1 Tax=Catellatospora citrea TaxID=53366 RepID=UPI0033D8D433